VKKCHTEIEQDLWAQGPEQDGEEGIAADILCQGMPTGDIGRPATRRDTTEDMGAEDMARIRGMEEDGEDGERKGKIRR
jgi:hypothetical protein